MDTRELKRIAERFSLEEIERCIDQQTSRGSNVCTTPGPDDEIFAELSKATVIRELMDQGSSFPEALRELGRRIRAVYSSPDR